MAAHELRVRREGLAWCEEGAACGEVQVHFCVGVGGVGVGGERGGWCGGEDGDWHFQVEGWCLVASVRDVRVCWWS